MPEPKHPPLQDIAIAMYYHAAKMIKAGKSHAEIERDLIERGVSQKTARIMLEKIAESQANVTRKNGLRNLTLGAVLCFVGMSLAFGFFGSAAVGAGAVFAWVVMAVGAYWFVRGTMQYTGL